MGTVLTCVAPPLPPPPPPPPPLFPIKLSWSSYSCSSV